MNTNPTTWDDIVAFMNTNNVRSEELNGLVEDFKADEASNINGKGLQSQLLYFREVYGDADLEELLMILDELLGISRGEVKNESDVSELG